MVKYNLDNKQQVLILGLLFCFVCLLNKLTAHVPPDSVSFSYPIDDPRNPACPCHQYQKIADEEYMQLLALNGKNKFTEIKNLVTAEYNGKQLNETDVTQAKKQHRRRYKLFFNRHHTGFSMKRKQKHHQRFLRRFKRIDDCFRF